MNYCEPCQRRGRRAEATRQINGEWFCEACFRGGDGCTPRSKPRHLRDAVAKMLMAGERQYIVAERLGLDRTSVCNMAKTLK